jgi:hypothetical protein
MDRRRVVIALLLAAIVVLYFTVPSYGANSESSGTTHDYGSAPTDRQKSVSKFSMSHQAGASFWLPSRTGLSSPVFLFTYLIKNLIDNDGSVLRGGEPPSNDSEVKPWKQDADDNGWEGPVNKLRILKSQNFHLCT